MAQSQTAKTVAETTVEVRATGHVRDALGTARLSYTFEGDTLREFAKSFFAEYDVQDLVIAETEDESATRGWAPIDAEDVPGDLLKNPDGEQTRAYARILINGKFNETLDGFDTKLHDDDRVALVYPFMFCV
ncbi:MULTISPECIES: pterin cluster protein [Halobellus]|jgi:molybdopterin converting factor small subunit|uniref:pterin cluster protein n=1 Tax=Halobellus TaxID=1073986 RepID=UPI00288050F8|nr:MULTISPECIES: pterin cluster protein [unclassified Halobellus]